MNIKEQAQIFKAPNRLQQGVIIVGITFRLFLETGKEAKKFEDCTKEEIKEFEKNASKRMSNTLSMYYTQNPQELQRIVSI